MDDHALLRGGIRGKRVSDATERHYAHAVWTARRDLIQTLADRPLTAAESALLTWLSQVINSAPRQPGADPEGEDLLRRAEALLRERHQP